MTSPANFTLRATIFTLAFFSFACLLGQFYGLWSMRLFACVALIPACLILVIIALISPAAPRYALNARTMIIEGTLGGILGAFAYDLYRLPFVLGGAPLFKVFPMFGELLMGGNGPQWLVQTVGWGYHFSNGAALGIMFLALAGSARPKLLFWGAVAWAVLIEAMLLMTPYTTFFGLRLDMRFLVLTATAHIVFGIALGAWCGLRLNRPAAAPIPRPPQLAGGR